MFVARSARIARSALSVRPAFRTTASTVAAHRWFSTKKSKPVADMKPRLNYKWISDNVESIQTNLEQRGMKGDPSKVAELYAQFVTLTQDIHQVRQQKNENAARMKGKLDTETRKQYIEEGKGIKQILSVLEEQLGNLEADLLAEGSRIPNTTYEHSPIGEEDQAIQLRLVNDKPVFDFEAKDHVELGRSLDLFEFDKAAQVSGSNFVYLKNEGES